MRKKPQVVPPLVTHALANLGQRIEKLESRTIERASEAISGAGLSLPGSKGNGPPNAMDTSINRLLDIINRVQRAGKAIQELGDAYDGSVPQSAVPEVPNGRAPLSSMISWLDREVDILLDHLGRIHPNPRS